MEFRSKTGEVGSWVSNCWQWVGAEWRTMTNAVSVLCFRHFPSTILEYQPVVPRCSCREDDFHSCRILGPEEALSAQFARDSRWIPFLISTGAAKMAFWLLDSWLHHKVGSKKGQLPSYGWYWHSDDVGILVAKKSLSSLPFITDLKSLRCEWLSLGLLLDYQRVDSLVVLGHKGTSLGTPSRD